MMFSNAIVRKPARSMVKGLTSANLGKPEYSKAIDQHGKYVEALMACGLKVRLLDADERFPDSTFVEDVALLTPSCAIMTNPGAESRKGEILEMGEVLSEYYADIEQIQAPGTLDAGDIMMVGSHFYIGLSGRTSVQGAEQMIKVLEKYGMSGSTVELKDVLHLKTGVAYLENNYLIVCGEFANKTEFKDFKRIEIPETESYAANCVWINDCVILPAGHPRSLALIQDAGFHVIEVDVSEFEKLDGGISCLSLRF